MTEQEKMNTHMGIYMSLAACDSVRLGLVSAFLAEAGYAPLTICPACNVVFFDHEDGCPVREALVIMKRQIDSSGVKERTEAEVRQYVSSIAES
jgi:hypothetical protein